MALVGENQGEPNCRTAELYFLVGPPRFEPGTVPALWRDGSDQACFARKYDQGWWAQQDSNLRPSGYEPVALTN